MAEFRYSSTIDEWWSLFDTILKKHGVRFAIDWWYPEPHCDYYDRIDDNLKHRILSTKRRVFFVGDAFSEGPLYLRQQSSGPRAGEYSIDLVRGGPMLDFDMPAQFEERGLFWFGEGRLTFQKLYWNDSLTRAYPAPKSLKDAFGMVKRTLQRQLLERKIDEKKRWISPNAWKSFEAGKAAFPVAGKCYTVNGEVPLPEPWKRVPIVGTKPDLK